MKFKDLKVGEYYLFIDEKSNDKYVTCAVDSGSTTLSNYFVFNDVVSFSGPDPDTGYRYSQDFFDSNIKATKINIKDFPEYFL